MGSTPSVPAADEDNTHMYTVNRTAMERWVNNIKRLDASKLAVEMENAKLREEKAKLQKDVKNVKSALEYYEPSQQQPGSALYTCFIWFATLIWIPYTICKITASYAGPPANPQPNSETLQERRRHLNEWDRNHGEALKQHQQRREMSTLVRAARPIRAAAPTPAPVRPAPLPAMNWGRIWRFGTRVVRR